MYAAVAGTITEVNEALAETPELINSGPYDDGWFVVIDPSDDTDLESLLDADGYRALTE